MMKLSAQRTLVLLLVGLHCAKADVYSDADASSSDYSVYGKRIPGLSEEDWRTSLYFSDDEQEERIVRAMERSGFFSTEADHEYSTDDENDADHETGIGTIDEFHLDERNQIEKERQNLPAIKGQTTRNETQSKKLSTDAPQIKYQIMPIPRIYRISTLNSTTARNNFNVPLSIRKEGPTLSADDSSVVGQQHRTNPKKLQPQKQHKGPQSLNDVQQQQLQQQHQQQQQQAALVAITTPWVRQFLASCHRDVLLPVPKDYCADNFNLVHLPPFIEKIARSSQVADVITTPTTKNKATTTTIIKPFPIYRQALKLLVQDQPVPANIPEQVDRAATALYLLLHQRYVLSPRGLDMVRRRFLLKATLPAGPSNASSSSSSSTHGTILDRPSNNYNNHKNNAVDAVDAIFGRCPSLACRGMPLLPIGDSDSYFYQDDNSTPAPSNSAEKSRGGTTAAAIENDHRAKRYCASCRQVFYHWDSKVDGCAWGTSFCHLFLLVCGKDVFGEWSRQPYRQRNAQDRTHVARVFGFKLHPCTQL